MFIRQTEKEAAINLDSVVAVDYCGHFINLTTTHIGIITWAYDSKKKALRDYNIICDGKCPTKVKLNITTKTT